MAKNDFYRCAECDQVLDRRKFPKTGTCPFCHPLVKQPDKSYHGSRAKEVPGVSKDSAIQREAKLAEAESRVKRTGRIFLGLRAGALIIVSALLVPYMAPRLTEYRLAGEFAQASYLQQHIGNLKNLSIGKTKSDTSVPAYKALTTQSTDLVASVTDLSGDGVATTRWIALLTGLLGAAVIASFYFRVVHWPEVRRLAELKSLALVVVIFTANLFFVSKTVATKTEDYASLSPQIKTMLSSLVHAELVNKDSGKAIAHMINGAQRDFVDQRGASLLHIAAENGLRDAVEQLIKMGLDINGRDNEELTPLHYAARRGQVLVASALIENGADLNATDATGRGILHVAAERQNVSVFRMLLKEGLPVDTVDKNGQTPLLLSAAAGNTDGVALLIEEGAGLEVKNADDHTLLQITLANVLEALQFLDGEEQSLAKKQVAVLREILDRGASPNVTDYLDQTPLHWVREARQGKRNSPELNAILDELTTLLLEFGAECSRRDLADRPAYTLHDAARFGHEAIARRLISAGEFTVHDLDESGRTAFQVSVEENQIELARLLLEEGADPGAWKGARSSGLVYAVENGNSQLVRLFLDQGVEWQASKNGREGPLLRAARNGNEDIVTLLVDKDFDINEQNSDGDSPLHLAASNGHEAVVQILIDRGADTTAWNRHGMTALDLAEALENRRIVSLIRRIPISPERVIARSN